MRPPRKILIIRFSSVGDIVLTSPVIGALRENHPGARIDFLTRKEFVELVRWNDGLSGVIVLPSPDMKGLKELRDRIRTERYDLIVDLHNSLRSRYLRAFSRAGRVRVVRKFVVRRFLLVRFGWNLFRTVTPVVSRYMNTVRPYIGREVGASLPAPPGLFLPDDLVSTAEGILFSGRFSKTDRLLGIAPCARHFTKRWPMEKFVRLCVQLSSEKAMKFPIFGGPDETDYCGDIAQLINAGAGTHCAESFAGRLSLSETAAALGLCGTVVTNDSGLMHLAAARGKKVVAIFGSTVRELGFYPAGEGHVILENDGLDCRPCSHIGRAACPKDHFRCMNDITVDSVCAAVKTLLDGA